ncbi:voltage-gated calcium channel alpha2-delta subunit 1 [Anopheles sinensis]|uniref:VGCC_alpha2 domain-containing protein n=1 Tax=Anopheles sinensis TaxID=74873 RepID=A0A084VTZ3_ANOSI|nr:voltage-gated calcium channel alpha2-delta subunit 1 [Anopheles sinensis]
MARPMVLYQADHPVHWSPVFMGGRSGVLGRESENRRKLVTTVSTPGNNWKVHPDWVYCEYNSLKDADGNGEGTAESTYRDKDESFDTPEEQMLHFLARVGRPGWKWMSLRPRSPQPHHGHGGIPVGHYAQHHFNSQGSRKAEPYYCDRTLVQSLVRDAIVTDGLDRAPSHPSRKEDRSRHGFSMFSVKTTFVATRSGLLRWIDHLPHSEDSTEPHFSETNARAMDMSWYKRAVDLYATEPEGFVFSVPFNSGYSGKNSSTLVTASHAIFIDHRGHKAPAAVVGLQFFARIPLQTFHQHHIQGWLFPCHLCRVGPVQIVPRLASQCTASTTCKKNCASDELDCYLLDDNGFVILSERSEHTGKFFGQIDGTIMDSLVQDRIYRRVPLMDYQGICSDRDNPYTGAGEPLKPVRPMSWLLQYFVSFATYWLSVLPTPIGALQHASYNYDGMEESDDEDTYDYEQPDYELPPEHSDVTTPDYEQRSTPTPQRSNLQAGPRVVPDPAHARPCDLKTDLYVLQPDRLNSSGQNNPLKGKLTNCHSSGCERPFSVQKIPNSNLILLVFTLTNCEHDCTL